MLIAQISDFHIAGPDRKTYGIAPMAENTSRCIDHINAMTPKPDLVMVSGDICDTGALNETRRAKTILDKLRMPYFVIPGNHDERGALFEVFGGAACPARDADFINYVIEPEAHELRLPAPLRVIAMDSTIPGETGGELGAKRLTWLDAQLASDRDRRPTLIFMHHPPVDVSLRETHVDGFIGANKLGKIVARYRNIERICCGHIHLLTNTRWHGTIVTTAPSMGLQLHLDLTMRAPSQWVPEDPGFLLHHWTNEHNLITHAITVRKRPGPYPFEDQAS